MDMMRLFVAIKIDPDTEFLSFFRMLKNALRSERIKWVEEHNLHITLKFLGETPEQSLPAIDPVLERFAQETSSFDYRLRGIGIFGSRYAPRVIWTALEPYDELVESMERLQDRLEPIGFKKERQNHVPHLTLGRIHSISDRTHFQRMLDRSSDFSGEVHTADSMILFESILKPSGPEYRVVRKYPFSKRISE
jgi:2'-5' RNA ligase